MPSFDASNATCTVLTFKEGVLSAIAHDLRLRVERFSIAIDEGEAIVATFEPSSLRVDCAMQKGQEARGTLSAKHMREIEKNITKDVLHVKRHPEIAFRSTKVEGEGDERRIEGTLTLHGKQRSLRCVARRRDGFWSTELDLHQPDHGIKPFSAMLGALKVQPVVKVRVRVPG